MSALVVGTLLALAALTFVLYPLLTSSAHSVLSETLGIGDPDVVRRQEIDALREIEFDRATGKLSDNDYESLKASYTSRAITAMRSPGGVVCPRCGPRPEREARFCSSCGAALAGS